MRRDARTQQPMTKVFFHRFYFLLFKAEEQSDRPILFIFIFLICARVRKVTDRSMCIYVSL